MCARLWLELVNFDIIIISYEVVRTLFNIPHKETKVSNVVRYPLVSANRQAKMELDSAV